MLRTDSFRVGYVVKRYPCYSETFIVREILAHERAGLEIEIFSLRPTSDGHFQDLIARVRGRVNYLYLPGDGLLPEALAAASLTAGHFWKSVAETAIELPEICGPLSELQEEEARYVYQALAVAREVRRKQIDHLHAPFAHEATTVARLAAKIAGVSYSFTARAKDIFHDRVRSDDLKRKLHDASGVITISEFHLDYLRHEYGPLADKVIRVYNGLDLEEFAYSEPRDRPPVILAVGRLVEKQGFGDLIDACEILARQGHRFGCRIVGAGALAVDLERRVQRAGLADRIELIGPRPQNEVSDEMRNAAVLAAPCIVGADGDRDGLPNVIQEAFALGTPVVSTDVTGIPEVVRDGETGLQVPQRDPEALAEALQRLLLDPALRVRLARAARRLIEAEFDIRRNSARRRALFRGEHPLASRPLVEAL
jgi:glycosyltransferase involved in cell wall biosynthesis